MESHDGSLVAALELFFVISCAEECQRDAVRTQRRLNDVRDVLDLLGVVKIGHILTGYFLMLCQVIIGSVRDAPQLAPTEGEEELDVGRRLGIEGELFLVVISHSGLFRLEAKLHQPVPAEVFPICKPLKVCIGLAEEFHLHLLELTGSEGEVAGCDLVTEGLADLADSERHFLTGCSLHILEVYEDTLCSLGS